MVKDTELLRAAERIAKWVYQGTFRKPTVNVMDPKYKHIEGKVRSMLKEELQ